MNYKIGNKVDVIVRSYNSGDMGSMTMQYKNQPYTILRDITATITFFNRDVSAEQGEDILLAFNHDNVSRINLSDVPLNDKLLDLLYEENEDALCSEQEYVTTDENGQFFISWPTDVVYQVFMYDDQGVLEQAFGTCDDTMFTMLKPNTQYSIYYSFKGTKSFLLRKKENMYVTLDLIITGNIEDETSDMCIHIEKCALSADKALFLRDEINTISLTARVIRGGNNYITIK